MCFYSAFFSTTWLQEQAQKPKKHCTARSARTGHERQQSKQFALSPLIRQTTFFNTVCLSEEILQHATQVWQ